MLVQLRAHPSVSRAADHVPVDRSTIYAHVLREPEFRAAVDAARLTGAERLEDVAIDRALDGWDEPVYQGGILVGHVRKHDNTLLVKMLGRFKPALYRERLGLEVSGPDGGPIPLTIADVKALVARNRLEATETPADVGSNGHAGR